MTLLRDKKAVDKITLRIRRVEQGNFGDYKSVSSICELRIDYSAGRRIYFGQMGNSIVVLLCGGDKNRQDKDIVTQEYWEDYKS